VLQVVREVDGRHPATPQLAVERVTTAEGVDERWGGGGQDGIRRGGANRICITRSAAASGRGAIVS
jgi:hypothetical protein